MICLGLVTNSTRRIDPGLVAIPELVQCTRIFFPQRTGFICQLEDLKWIMTIIPGCFPSYVAIRMMLIGYIKITVVAFCTHFTFCPQLRWYGI